MKSQSQLNNKSNEVIKLIKEFQETNDERIQLLLVEKYKSLVESLALKYSRGRNIHEDIVQVGMIGLLGAIKRYDPQYGKGFETFAVPTIMGEIKRYLRDKTWSIHVPRRIKELGPKIKSAVDILTTELQCSPQINEIASYLKVTEEEVLETMEMGKSYQALSMDRTIEADADGSTVTLLDMIGNHDEGFETVNRKVDLQSSLKVLTDQERSVLVHIFLDSLSQKETGVILGISQMHVSRLQRRAIQKLKQSALVNPEDSECLT